MSLGTHGMHALLFPPPTSAENEFLTVKINSLRLRSMESHWHFARHIIFIDKAIEQAFLLQQNTLFPI